MPLHRLLAPALMLCALPGAHAAQEFGHKDWSVVCDNTRHCQAAGYQALDAGAEQASEPVALVIARAAGPATPLKATLIAQSSDGSTTNPVLTVRAGATTIAGIAADQAMTAAQLNALLPALLTADRADVSAGTQRWTLSLAGMKAVLLKMDEWQGRLDTPGALAQKGMKAESTVLPPVAPPTLIPAPLQATVAADRALLPAILNTMPKSTCEADSARGAKPEARLYRLSASKLLILRLCERFAYQSTYTVWTANARAPYAPVLVRLPLPGKAEDEVMEASYSDGVLSSFVKARGPADCGEAYSWLWTASGFALLSASEAPACRGIPGGVHFPTWVATRGARAR